MNAGSKLFVVFSLGIMAVGCASSQTNMPISMQGLNPPAWVTKGSGAFGGDKGRVFYGVGMSSMPKNSMNESLARDQADNHAINAIQKIFDTYSASLMKDYQAATMSNDPGKASEESHVEQAMKTFTAGQLSGVQVVDRWQNPNTAAWYSLAQMDLNTFADNMGKMKELNTQARDFVRKNAERVHQDLEKEESKHAEDSAPAAN